MGTKTESLAFTVAECGAFHSLGKFYDNITTLEEAVIIYEKMVSECMDGIPSIGIKLHTKGKEKWEDIQVDIVSGSEIDTGILEFIPELHNNLLVQGVIKEMIKRFPDKEIV